MSASELFERPASSPDDPQLRRAFLRGREAAADGKSIPDYIITGCRDVHLAWLDGYMYGVTLTD